MAITTDMRSALKEAMKAKDRTRMNFLRYWIAQFTLGDGTELDDEAAIKKMRGILKEAETGQTSFTQEEIVLLREWLPQTLSQDQIRERLQPVAEQIRGFTVEGPAMGVAMKTLKGEQVDSADVKAVVSEIRS